MNKSIIDDPYKVTWVCDEILNDQYKILVKGGYKMISLINHQATGSSNIAVSYDHWIDPRFLTEMDICDDMQYQLINKLKDGNTKEND